MSLHPDPTDAMAIAAAAHDAAIDERATTGGGLYLPVRRPTTASEPIRRAESPRPALPGLRPLPRLPGREQTAETGL
jgi:hypothetical protein